MAEAAHPGQPQPAEPSHPEVLWCRNGLAVQRGDVPQVLPAVFKRTCVDVCSKGARLAVLCTLPPRDRGTEEMLAVLADDAQGSLGLVRAQVPASRRYPALSTELPQAQAFERELLEDHAIHPEGHPWPKPLRKH